MSTITLANHIRSIISSIRTQLTDQERTIYIATSLAMAISYQLPIPSTPVQLLHTHFAASFDKQICDIVNEVNEQYVIDTRMCRDLVFKWYSLRYDLVHAPRSTGQLISKIASHLPEYFPQRVMDVMGKTNLQDTEECLTVCNAWDDVRNAVVTHMLEKYNAEDVQSA